MASKFHLEIVTPDKVFYDDEVEMVIARTTEGDVGVLASHIAMVAPLKVSKLRIRQEEDYKEAAIAGGFIKVSKDGTTIIVDSAEWPEEIDIERAQAAKDRAEKRLDVREGIDIIRAEAALNRALNRIDVYETRKQ